MKNEHNGSTLLLKENENSETGI